MRHQYAQLIAAKALICKQSTASSWRMNEFYIRVKGRWVYQYRATDKHGKTLDFLSLVRVLQMR